MTVTDIATRTYNHGWRLDPIIRSILDTDFYKLLMLQMIWELHPDVRVTFSLINRSRRVRLAEVIDEKELRAQLDHARTVQLTRRSRSGSPATRFYGKAKMFSSEFLSWFAEFRLPEYDLRKVDGQYELQFEGPWTHTTMWEIPALAIVNELRSRQAMKGHGRFALDVLYARAKAKLWTKVERLKPLEGLLLSDFGTRRRHGFLWQRWCVEAVKEGLGRSFTGTSNVLLAMDNDLEAIGTNAHELPMVAAALANSDEALRRAPYRVLEEWRKMYARQSADRPARCLRHHRIPAGCAGLGRGLDGLSPRQRPAHRRRRGDHRWWNERGRDPRKKILIFSDAMDVDTIEGTFLHFRGRVRLSFGWGTNLTNDFIGCTPDGAADLDPISLVCKVT